MRCFSESMRLLAGSLKAAFQLMHGLKALSRLSDPLISIFGGKGVKADSVYAKQAYEIAAQCVAHGMSVLTGGGPGLMEAANCGAFEQAKSEGLKKPHTLGIGVRGVDEDFINPCTSLIKVDYLFIRKWLLIRYTAAFIIFPGGIGTADELFDLLNLMKLQRIKQVPVVLIGVSYWQPIVHWYNQSIDQGFIKKIYQDLFFVTDDITQAFTHIHNAVMHTKQ